MWGEITWDDFVKGASRRYGGLEQSPEGVVESLRWINKRLKTVRERLKNPINLKDGGQLKPSSILQLKNQEKELTQQRDAYRKLIKQLVKFNLLPTSKLISGADRKNFIFSLQTMIELPEFGQAVYYANRLMNARYDNVIPATDTGYIQLLKDSPGRLRDKQEERSRESMYNALLNSLNEVFKKIQAERQRLLDSGTPWKSNEADSETADSVNAVANEAAADNFEKQNNSKDNFKNEYSEIQNLTPDVFINQQAFYEQVGAILENLDTDVFVVSSSIEHNLGKEWVPKDIRHSIERAKDYIGQARSKIKAIHEIFQTEKAKGARAIINPSRNRIERMTVYRGGLYKKTEIPSVGGDPVLTTQGEAWLRSVREKSEQEAGANDDNLSDKLSNKPEVTQ